ncbi:PHO86 Inorganic phosphate transporter PHO86 [Candida maltosa Xu316]|uniref:Inorganic phosphate transporter, putative n=1 Tax=Candida maltosa (strain Xu316) TaxID=1245528 RepID=M3ILA5_CANMX|nr:Inorganic phosphate transporter, putative [Candida maltosa Xu316]
MPVEQKDLDLNKPLDVNIPPTLGKTSLTPELSKAAIVLHGDHYKQLQAKLTKYVLWHPYAVILYTLSIPLVIGYGIWEYMIVCDSLIEFYFLIMRNKKDFIFAIFSSFPILASIFGCFGFLAYVVGEDMGIITSKFYAQKYCDSIFGFDIKAFSQNENNKDKKLAKLGKNTELIIYRESPIAIGTLVVDEEQSTTSKFVVKITGIHVRKVFQKVDFDVVLIEWAILRARELYQEYLTSQNVKTPPENSFILVSMDAYSFDGAFEKTLLNNGFKLLDVSYELNPFSPSGSNLMKRVFKLLNVSRDTFGIMLTVGEEDIELLNKNPLTKGENKARKRA